MKAWRPLLLCVPALLLFASVEAAPSNFGDASDDARPYEGYQVLSVVATTAEQLNVLAQLRESPNVDFWSFQQKISATNLLSVGPDDVDEVVATLRRVGSQVKTVIPDLQELVDQEKAKHDEARIFSNDLDNGVTFTRYMRYDEIRDYARELQVKYPLRVSVQSIGKTVEGRDLWVIKVTGDLKPRDFEKRRAVFVDAGIHAREWIAPATALYLLNQLVENKVVSDELTNGLDWYIVPVLNPDGYEYSHTKKRLWRKNRRVNTGNCIGVDLNRNFEFHWNENGASSNPCAETYSGTRAASEPETQALSKFLLDHKSEIVMYLTLHSYGNYLLYPWGYTSSLPNDWEELDRIAKLANKAMVAAGSRPYKIGSSTNVLYAAAGGSDDYAKGIPGIQKSYTIELPGGGSYGFDMPPEKINQTVTQVFEGLRVFAKEARKTNAED